MFSGCFSLAVAQSLNPFCLGKYQERKMRFYLQLWKLKGSYLLSSLSLAAKMSASELNLSWAVPLGTLTLGKFMQISRSQAGNRSRSSSSGGKGCYLETAVPLMTLWP